MPRLVALFSKRTPVIPPTNCRLGVLPYGIFCIALRPTESHPYPLAMNPEDQARSLCDKAIATQDPNELAEIMAKLRALIRQQLTHVEEMIQERGHRADLEHVLDKSA